MNSEKVKKYFHKIKIFFIFIKKIVKYIFELYKNNKIRTNFYFATVLIVIYILFYLPNGIADVFLINEPVILLLLLITVIPSVWFYYFLTIFYKRPNLNNVITAFSIITAVFFILIQNFNESFSKLIVIQHSSYLNCENAKTLSMLDSDRVVYPRAHFNIEVYKDNLDFISNNFSQETLYAAQDAISQMDILNNLIDTESNLLLKNNFLVTPEILKLNMSLIDYSKSISNTTCLKLNDLYAATKKYTEASFMKVLNQYFGDMFKLLF